MSGAPPRVSVCIPAYNRRDTLRASLWSVLRQTFQDFEVVISDNASEEDLAAEVAAAGDTRIRYVRQERNLGAAGNFRFLPGVATGEYLLFLCSDDLLLPDCLARAVAALDTRPERDIAIYMAAHYDDRGFSHLSAMPAGDGATRADYDRDESVRDFRHAAPSLCLYRQTTFAALGGWDRRLEAVFDWEMYARTILRGGGVVFLHEVLALMRLHGDRVSNNSALLWGFYHDVMLLSGRREYGWGGAYRAMAFVEQLLWDWRLRRSPRRTLRHVRDAGAMLDVVLYLPYELTRRTIGRVRSQIGDQSRLRPEPPSGPGLAALDALWRESEDVRAGR